MPTLDELLVSTKLLSPMQLAVARRDADIRHKRLAPTIIDLGLVDEVRFAEWMSRMSGTRLVHPLPDDAVERLERRVPRGIAREFEIVPLELRGDELTVATINPLDRAALDILETATRLRVQAVAARYGELMRLVQRFYPEDDAEPTILPAGFAAGDESPGVTTQMISPRAAETQLDRIERQLSALTVLVETLQKKIDAINNASARTSGP